MSQVFYALYRFDQYGVDTVKILTKMVIGNFKKFGFRIIEQVEYICTVFIGIADDFTADPDEFPLNEFLQDDAGMGFNIGCRNYGISQLGHIIGTTDHFQFFTEAEFFHHGEHVYRLAFLLPDTAWPDKFAGGSPRKNIPA